MAKVTFQGKPLTDPICTFLVHVLASIYIVGLAPLWIPVHVTLRILGRNGFLRENAVEYILSIDLEGFKKKALDESR